VLVGQGVRATAYDPLADVLDEREAREALHRMQSMIREQVNTLPKLSEFVDRYCLARTGGGTTP